MTDNHSPKGFWVRETRRIQDELGGILTSRYEETPEGAVRVTYVWTPPGLTDTTGKCSYRWAHNRGVLGSGLHTCYELPAHEGKHVCGLCRETEEPGDDRTIPDLVGDAAEQAKEITRRYVGRFSTERYTKRYGGTPSDPVILCRWCHQPIVNSHDEWCSDGGDVAVCTVRTQEHSTPRKSGPFLPHEPPDDYPELVRMRGEMAREAITNACRFCSQEIRSHYEPGVGTRWATANANACEYSEVGHLPHVCHCGGPEEAVYGHPVGTGRYCRA